MKKYNLLRLIILVLGLLIIFFTWRDLGEINVKDIISGSENVYKRIVIALSLYAIKSVLFFIPIPVLYISVGMFFPLYIAIIVNLLGVTLEITLTFFYGRFLGKDFVEKVTDKSAKLRKGIELNQQNDFIITFFLRMIPFGIELVSLVLGASGNYYHRYIIASLMGITPKLIVFSVIGNAITNSLNIGSILLFTIAILIWGIFVHELKKRDYVTFSNL
ncbi:Uncharacterized membrane protein YdjX, TVP38/TMEM64 family, SNARE-associated domain [Anaerobranca californiensis DSM 14826]|jgi:uncharacterized membrane protein YdjX (TVP38/TMEM64 family)|uniref:TVP38/TMEM64 family membrane protein n=1 Tax=Anaerobranca californiensis DSM 14826 TaxID=1120989 RepID=A0A1M6MVF0_9FIRM|nr:VTT domain-containing protein [Anaerobranca californiensis]SHJ87451.1 Uncharacterized membrane protein YdjX, TVP38/TMEM64 family, SNARE-associated domain [Anaerobranca californiensis DSM 14826]